MLYFYSEDMFFINRAKSFVKKLLGKQNRGPQVVLQSLKAGLQEKEEAFCVNWQISTPIETACVISGVKTLKWAILQKQNEKIKKIIAGPNIVVFPDDEDSVLKHPSIDIIIVPSVWVKELYCLLAPEIGHKIRIWPAGVLIPNYLNEKKNLDFLVYDKTNQSPLCREVVDYLQENKFSFTVLNYGNFHREDYFKLLGRSKFEVYLSQSESQGLAMFEAWARNVPTFVWESGKYAKRGVEIMGQISSPFLTGETGIAFSDFTDFKNKLGAFLKEDFSPKYYVEQNFTNKISAQKYLDIIYETQNI